MEQISQKQGDSPRSLKTSRLHPVVRATVLTTKVTAAKREWTMSSTVKLLWPEFLVHYQIVRVIKLIKIQPALAHSTSSNFMRSQTV